MPMPTPMAKPRILIIEDERGLTEVLTYNLQREGYETIVAHDSLRRSTSWMETSPHALFHPDAVPAPPAGALRRLAPALR